MRLKWLHAALRNLDDEASYIAADDPAAARLVVRRILSAVALLVGNPAMGRPGRVAGTRELLIPKTRYLVPYRVRKSEIQILRIFHIHANRLHGGNELLLKVA